MRSTCLLLAITASACSPSTERLLDDVEIDVASFGELPDDADQVWELDADDAPALSFAASGLFGIPARGVWSRYNVRVVTRGASPTAWTVSFLADMDSIETGVDRLDEHIRSTDYLDVADAPEGRFQSTGLTSLGGDRYEVAGDLTLRGTTRPIRYEATISPGTDHVASQATLTLSRWDFGLYADDVTEPGGDGASDEVTVDYDVKLGLVYRR